MCYQPQLVLSDSLLKKYCNLSCDIQTNFYSEIKNLLSFYKQHVYNVEQYSRIGIPLDDGLKTALARNNNAKSLIFKGSLENLADYTLLKIILDDEKGDYPYVNINSDTEELKMNLTGCFKKNESRKKCIDHIKRLCKNARTIIIYDKYCESQLQKILNLVCNSNNELKLQIISDENGSQITQEWNKLKNQYPKIKLECPRSSSYTGCHDRYMMISSDTGKTEILLSSGFYNLFDQSKDFTYVVRVIKD